jgi:hypothetical protein
MTSSNARYLQSYLRRVPQEFTYGNSVIYCKIVLRITQRIKIYVTITVCNCRQKY